MGTIFFCALIDARCKFYVAFFFFFTIRNPSKLGCKMNPAYIMCQFSSHYKSKVEE